MSIAGGDLLSASTACFIYNFVIQVISENNRNYNSCRFSYNFVLILFLSKKKEDKKQESGFQAGGLVTRNISVFLFIDSRALLQGHAEFRLL